MTRKHARAHTHTHTRNCTHSHTHTYTCTCTYTHTDALSLFYRSLPLSLPSPLFLCALYQETRAIELFGFDYSDPNVFSTPLASREGGKTAAAAQTSASKTVAQPISSEEKSFQGAPSPPPPECDNHHPEPLAQTAQAARATDRAAQPRGDSGSGGGMSRSEWTGGIATTYCDGVSDHAGGTCMDITLRRAAGVSSRQEGELTGLGIHMCVMALSSPGALYVY